MTPVSNVFSCAMVAVLMAAALAACGKKSADNADTATGLPAATAPATSSQAKDTSPAALTAAAKMNGYTEAYNKLIGTFGLTETHERYLKADITKKKASDSISITDGWVEIALNQLKTARALPGAAPGQLDASADTLIASLDKLVVQLKGLDVYYESKSYREDQLARGKAEDAEMRANFDASVAATDKFNLVLSAEEKKANTVILERLKASGNLLGYSTKLALQQGQEIVNTFADEKDFRDAEKYKQADAVVVALEKTLAEQRQHYDAAKAKDASTDSGHASTASSLVSLIGDYRDLKQSKSAKDFNSIVKDYNSAVESANGID